MHEMPPIPERPMTKEQMIVLARELKERVEGFPFKGLEDEAYATLKAEGDEYPGMATPIDDVIKRLEALGMKVVFGDHEASGNVFILPLDSSDVENDGVLPRHLKIAADMDPGLKKLIQYSKANKKK